MNIKDFIDIEPKQKNMIIIFFGMFSVSFLQIFLFKRELIRENFFILSILSLALSFYWYLSSSLSVIFFYLSLKSRQKKDTQEQSSYLVITFLGFIFLFWIYLITFIAYELNLSFKEFIKLSILISLIKTFFWFIVSLIRRKVFTGGIAPNK